MKQYFEQYLIQTIEGSSDEMLERLNDNNELGTGWEYEIIILIYVLDEITTLEDELLPNIIDFSRLTFVFPSQFDRYEYSSLFDDVYVEPDYHQITFLSRSSLFYSDFVMSYGSDLKYLDHTFYGWVIGKWVGTNFVSSIENGEDFFEQAFDPTHSITFQSEVVIDFQGGECNIGIRDIFLYDCRSDELLYEVDYSEDQGESDVDYETYERRKCTLYDSFVASDHEMVNYDLYYWIFIPPTPILFAGFIVNLFVCCILSCCCFCCCFTLISICTFMSIIIRSRKRLQKFNKLRDVDLLIKEQEMEDNVDVAHLKINSKMFQIKISEIEFVKILGEGGSNSIVYKSKFRNKIVAFKCFRTTQFCTTEENFVEFEREVEVLSSISHPNIVSFYGACLDPPRVGFIMEFCELGDLSEFLGNYGTKDENYPYREKLRMVSEISTAVDYIHSRKIIHRDLKLENVLVATGEICKLMDFGLSRIVKEMGDQKKTKKIGTSEFMAPEIIRLGDYDEKCDVFSFAIMLFVIFTENYRPYGESYMIELQVAYSPDRRPNINEVIEDESIPSEEKSFLVDLMVKLWDDTPSKRLGFDEVTPLLIQRLEDYDISLNNNNNVKDDFVVDNFVFKQSNEEKEIIIGKEEEKKISKPSKKVRASKHYKYDARKESVVWKKKDDKEDKDDVQVVGELICKEEVEGNYKERYQKLLQNVKNLCTQEGVDFQRFIDGV